MASLQLQDDGNLVLYTRHGRAIWTPSSGIIPRPGPTPSWNGNYHVNLGMSVLADAGQLIAYIDRGRSAEGVPALMLPYNWPSLTRPQKLLTLINLERVDRGLPAFPGLESTLDALAVQGAITNTDPPFSFGIWVGGGRVSPLGAVAIWMYDDGPGGVNSDCTLTNHSWCYAHAVNILRTSWNGIPGTPELGAATATTSIGDSLAAAMSPIMNPILEFSWAEESRYR